MTHGKDRGGVVFPIVFIVGGLAILCGIWGPPLAAAFSARSWPESEAEVVFSQVGETPIGGNADPIVVFVYSAAGREYLAAGRSLFPVRAFTRASAEAFVGRYPAGRRLPCFVNPAAPHQAVLDRGFVPPLDWLNAFLFMLAAAFLTIGLGILGRTWRVERGS